MKYLLLLIATLFACSQSPVSIDSSTVVAKENPYSVANMSKAAESLGYPAMKPTHYYIKTNKNVSNELVCFYHPINSDVPEGVDEYKSWCYTWIPIDSVVSFEYEIIDEIVLQDNKLSKTSDNYEEIERQSRILTGDIKIDGLKKSLAWYPEGWVKILDDTVGGKYYPVYEVTVLINDWFKSAAVNTGANGYFKCGHTSFTGSVYYSLRLNSPGYKVDVKDENYNTIHISGPQKNNSGWWYDVKDVNSYEWFAVTTYFGASSAYQYSGTNYTPCINIRALNKKSDDTKRGLFSYDIFGAGCAAVWRYTNECKKVGFLQLATTAAHESGHYMHWHMDKKTYGEAGGDHKGFQLQETWAVLRAYDVATYIRGSGWVYGSNLGMLATFTIHAQMLELDTRSIYLPLFVDLKDTYNQHRCSTYAPEDFTSGKTTLQMERIMKDNKCKSLRDFMGAISRDCPEDYMDEYFWWYYNAGF